MRHFNYKGMRLCFALLSFVVYVLLRQWLEISWGAAMLGYVMGVFAAMATVPNGAYE